MKHPVRSAWAASAIASLCCSAFGIGNEGCLRLKAPCESSPGDTRELVVSGARPGGWVGFFVASHSEQGAQPIDLNITRSYLLGVAPADSHGGARWSVEIPAELVGSAILFQAWQVGSCTPSNTVAMSVASGIHRLGFEVDYLAPGEQYDPPDFTPITVVGYSFAPTSNGTICCSCIWT